jgi:type IV pilus assembly protein PilN
MAKINLLPWRQELRKQRKQEFLAIVMGVALVALAILLFLHMMVSAQLGDQEERKAYVKSEIDLLDKQIAEIEELQKRKDELLSRMKVIQDLQGRRPVIVRVFDEIVRATPDKLYLTSIERKGDQFKISGNAESNNQVATFLRNLNASAWFKNPVLGNVTSNEVKTGPGGRPVAKTEKDDKPKTNGFSLTVDLEAPEPAGGAEGKDVKKTNKETSK